MRVRLVNRGIDGDTMCFKVIAINTGIEYTISNCLRSEHPMWRVHGIQHYIGNVEFEDGTIRKACLRLSQKGNHILSI